MDKTDISITKLSMALVEADYEFDEMISILAACEMSPILNCVKDKRREI